MKKIHGCDHKYKRCLHPQEDKSIIVQSVCIKCGLAKAYNIEGNKIQTFQWWAWYNEYLLSQEWREKRQLILHNAGGMCEVCGENPAVQVHHISYKHVGNEPLCDLKAVCDECHDVIHKHQEDTQ